PDTAIPDSLHADDGTPLLYVTVVQPCAVPSATPNAVTVSVSDPVAEGPLDPSREVTVRVRTAVSPPWSGAVILSAPRSLAENVRSEERRVGAECRSQSVPPAGIPVTVAGAAVK